MAVSHWNIKLLFDIFDLWQQFLQFKLKYNDFTEYSAETNAFTFTEYFRLFLSFGEQTDNFP